VESKGASAFIDDPRDSNRPSPLALAVVVAQMLSDVRGGETISGIQENHEISLTKCEALVHGVVDSVIRFAQASKPVSGI
jgi:hypothetical protein